MQRICLKKPGRQGSSKAERKYYVTKVAFGYVRSEDKTRQVVDETVAPVVRMIFQWTLLGVSKREIADRLNLLGVATPGTERK